MSKIHRYIESAKTSGKPLSHIMLKNEARKRGITQKALTRGMEKTYSVMRDVINKGMHYTEPYISDITGDVAGKMEDYLKTNKPLTGPLISEVIRRALSATKSNSMMNVIVAAPTAGSSGILPAVLTTFEDQYKIPRKKIVQSLFTAGLIAKIIDKQVTLAGAAGGCMAECGSASAMAAAAIVEIMDGTPEQCVDAAALALKQHLGQVCDTIAGLVECPCIKRNSMSAVTSIVASEMALAGITSVVPFDEVLIAMKEIADKMDSTLRETSLGGLAKTPTGVKLAEKLAEIERSSLNDKT